MSVHDEVRVSPVSVLSQADGVRAGQDVPDGEALLSQAADYIMRTIPDEDWGEAFILAKRILPRYTPRWNNEKYHTPLSFARYFWMRWNFHKKDLKRVESGARCNPESRKRLKPRLFNERYMKPVRNHGFRDVEDRDAIRHLASKVGVTRRQRLIVECLASGLTLLETGRACGVGESMIWQEIHSKGMADRLTVVEKVT